MTKAQAERLRECFAYSSLTMADRGVVFTKLIFLFAEGSVEDDMTTEQDLALSLCTEILRSPEYKTGE